MKSPVPLIPWRNIFLPKILALLRGTPPPIPITESPFTGLGKKSPTNAKNSVIAVNEVKDEVK